MHDGRYNAPHLGHVLLRLPELPTLISLQSYVPGIVRCKASVPKLQLLYNIEQHEIISDKGNIISLGGPWSAIRTADIPHLLYAILRKHWLAQNLLPLHAAAVRMPTGQAILLAGPSGVGKTTLCGALIKNNDWHFISGNKCLLTMKQQNLGILAGTVTQSILQPDGSRLQIKARNKAQLPLSVRAVILPYLNDGAQNWQQLTPLSALHTLFPLCLDAMNADVLVAGGSALYDGAIESCIKQKLGNYLTQILIRIPVYRGVGSLEFLSHRIKECA